MNALGNSLRNLRNAAGLTQPQLAERAGIEQGYLSKLENGRATPSHEVVERLAMALSVTAEQLTAPNPMGRPGRVMYALGAVFGIAAIAVGLLMASPNGPSSPMMPPGMPLSVTLAIDAAPADIQLSHVMGPPGGMLSVKGHARSERALRGYIDTLARAGRIHLVEMTPVRWYRGGGIEFGVWVDTAREAERPFPEGASQQL